jgi:hypothetical protein
VIISCSIKTLDLSLPTYRPQVSCQPLFVRQQVSPIYWTHSPTFELEASWIDMNIACHRKSLSRCHKVGRRLVTWSLGYKSCFSPAQSRFWQFKRVQICDLCHKPRPALARLLELRTTVKVSRARSFHSGSNICNPRGVGYANAVSDSGSVQPTKDPSLAHGLTSGVDDFHPPGRHVTSIFPSNGVFPWNARIDQRVLIHLAGQRIRIGTTLLQPY